MTSLPMPTSLAHVPLPKRAPSLRRVLAEVATPLQAFRLLRRLRDLTDQPAPDTAADHVVIDIPGYFTPEWSMVPLRRYLRWLGYDARGWGYGHNTSDVVGKVRAFVPEVRRVAREHGPITLIGWSLGGLVAREVARDTPSSVAHVITYGTPVIGGPRFTNARLGYSREDVDAFAAAADARAKFPLRVPVTAMVSRRDGIVAHQAQIDHLSPDVRHVEIGSTHLGMGLDPDVWQTTAGTLAATVHRHWDRISQAQAA